ncbi:hypothetical protein ANO14919_115800 [Xylariales sp. No.14919]|nr:hypothetical protein ANO14919_115800 [Xylariales sp. No.14919]
MDPEISSILLNILCQRSRPAYNFHSTSHPVARIVPAAALPSLCDFFSSASPWPKKIGVEGVEAEEASFKVKGPKCWLSQWSSLDFR